jgi:hypothetical protein
LLIDSAFKPRGLKMVEAKIFRVRIRLNNDQVFYFANAMNPQHALAKEPDLAQRFYTELAALQFCQAIISSTGPYFNRVREVILKSPDYLASVHIDRARLKPDGLAGVWTELPRGGICLAHPVDTENLT